MTDAKIEKVMTSNLLYTLFFTDGSSLEIYKSHFRGVSRPKAGDMFGIRQEEQTDGSIVSRIFLNGKEVRGKTL